MATPWNSRGPVALANVALSTTKDEFRVAKPSDVYHRTVDGGGTRRPTGECGSTPHASPLPIRRVVLVAGDDPRTHLTFLLHHRAMTHLGEHLLGAT